MSGGPHRRAGAVVLVCLVVLAALAASDAAGLRRAWLAAYLLGASTLAFAWSRRSLWIREGMPGTRSWLVAGLGCYAAGEVLWFALVVLGRSTDAGVADVLVVVAGVVAGVGLVKHLGREMVGDRPEARVELWTDAAACAVAVAAGTALRIGHMAEGLRTTEVVLLLVHPAAFLIPGAIGVIAALLSKHPPGLRGPYAFALGWILIGSTNGSWTQPVLHESVARTMRFDLLSGLGLLLAGLGVATWEAPRGERGSTRWRGASRRLAELVPSAALSGVLLYALLFDAPVSRGTRAVALIGVVLALLARQAVLLALADRGRSREARAGRDAAAALEGERTAVARLRAIAEHARDAFWLIDADGQTVLYVSPSVRDIFGIPDAELTARGRRVLIDAVLPEDRDRVRRWPSGLPDGEGTVCDYRIALASGEIRDIVESARLVAGPDGTVERYVLVSRDATEERLREARLLRLETAVQAMDESVVIADRDGMIRFVNPAFERITGYDARTAIGRNPRLLKSGRHDQAFYLSLWTTILAGETWQGTIVNRRRGGELYDAQLTITPMRDESGEVTQFVSVMRDISRERELERAVREAQRMESIGRLSAGVAHDFNNLLTVINGYASLLLKEAPAESDQHAALAEIARAGESAASLTRQLLAFSRKQVFRMQQVDLAALLADFEVTLGPLVGQDVSIALRISDDVPTVRIDPAQLKQVLTNLVVNAREAMPAGGRVEIACEREAPAGGGDAPHAVIRVRDDGRGIPEEIRARIFDPFFTTKPVGEGIGLGLSTAYGIVTQAGGELSVSSELGVGSTFRIRLPASQGFGGGDGTDPPVAPSGMGRGVVLLIEDDDAVRGTVETVLRRGGYVVRVAGGRDEALRAAARGAVDVIVSDVILPGTSGRQIVEELSGVLGRVPVLYISGYPAEHLSERGVLDDGVELLRKPFPPDELLRRVERLRAGRGAAVAPRA